MEVKSQLEGGDRRGRRANFLTYSLCIPKAGRAQDDGRTDEHGVADGLDSDYDDDDVIGSKGLLVSPIKSISSYTRFRPVSVEVGSVKLR